MCRGGPATGTLLQGPLSPGKLPMGAKDWAGSSGGSLGMTGLQPSSSGDYVSWVLGSSLREGGNPDISGYAMSRG